MKEKEPLYKSPGTMNFAYCFVFPFVAFFICVGIFEHNFLMIFFCFLGFIVLVMFLYHFVCRVKVFDNKILVKRTFKQSEYDFQDIKIIWDFTGIFFRPPNVILWLKNEKLFNKLVIFFPPFPEDPKINSLKALFFGPKVKKKTVVEFIKEIMELSEQND